MPRDSKKAGTGSQRWQRSIAVTVLCILAFGGFGSASASAQLPSGCEQYDICIGPAQDADVAGDVGPAGGGAGVRDEGNLPFTGYPLTGLVMLLMILLITGLIIRGFVGLRSSAAPRH